MAEFALQVENLVKVYAPRGLFSRERAAVQAVNGMSFSVKPGSIFGLVGAERCGEDNHAEDVDNIGAAYEWACQV